MIEQRHKADLRSTMHKPSVLPRDFFTRAATMRANFHPFRAQTQHDQKRSLPLWRLVSNRICPSFLGNASWELVQLRPGQPLCHALRRYAFVQCQCATLRFALRLHRRCRCDCHTTHITIFSAPS
jgi:hypothetical protein